MKNINSKYPSTLNQVVYLTQAMLEDYAQRISKIEKVETRKVVASVLNRMNNLIKESNLGSVESVVPNKIMSMSEVWDLSLLMICDVNKISMDYGNFHNSLNSLKSQCLESYDIFWSYTRAYEYFSLCYESFKTGEKVMFDDYIKAEKDMIMKEEKFYSFVEMKKSIQNHHFE
jgi:hypothetical protein